MAQDLNYIQCGDYYIPDIKLEHTGTQQLDKYGKMRTVFLEQNKSMLFNDMVITEILFPHLWEVQQNCEDHKEWGLCKCAKNLGIGYSTLTKWRKKFREFGDILVRDSENRSSKEQKEFTRLKHKLRDAQNTLHVLKKR